MAALRSPAQRRTFSPPLSAKGGSVSPTANFIKTDAFLEAQPFGTVPAAFSPDGRIGIFESNSIMRAVARLARNRFPIYGHQAADHPRRPSGWRNWRELAATRLGRPDRCGRCSGTE